MRRKQTYIFCILTIFCAALCSAQAPSAPAAEDGFEAQLKILEAQLDEKRLQSMQEEISGQALMFSQWKEYAQHIKRAEAYEEEAKEIAAQIEALKAKQQAALPEQDL